MFGTAVGRSLYQNRTYSVTGTDWHVHETCSLMRRTQFEVPPPTLLREFINSTHKLWVHGNGNESKKASVEAMIQRWSEDFAAKIWSRQIMARVLRAVPCRAIEGWRLSCVSDPTLDCFVRSRKMNPLLEQLIRHFPETPRNPAELQRGMENAPTRPTAIATFPATCGPLQTKPASSPPAQTVRNSALNIPFDQSHQINSRVRIFFRRKWRYLQPSTLRCPCSAGHSSLKLR